MTRRPARFAVPPRGPVRTRAAVLAATLATALVLALAACGSDDADGPLSRPGDVPTPTSTPTTPAPTDEEPDRFEVAVNDLREDSVYPDIGEPVVDALHYDLQLRWAPRRDLLVGREVLTFRAAVNAPTIPLDLGDALEIAQVRLDGSPVDFTHRGTRLTVQHPVVRDGRHRLTLTYRGTPRTAPAPSRRSDFDQGVGWSITPEHETWTLQEPYGAFTWYAVNDHPSDKALYDFTLRVPAPWSGVANGRLVEAITSGATSTHRWHAAEPMAPYLVTVAFGDFQHTDLRSSSGVPLQVWADADGDPTPGDTDYLPEAVDWVESVLGPYPFDSLGIVVVDNDSGMETQTMITLGDNVHSLSAGTVVHEVVHQWYGDTVTPADWSDVWMNEGMAMYLQGVWEAEQEGITVTDKMDAWAVFEPSLRESSGPPGDYDPTQFGDGNIYYGPALMWHELRQEVGDDLFLTVLREWPAAQANGTADRDEYVDWIEATTSRELSAFFHDWLLSASTPSRG